MKLRQAWKTWAKADDNNRLFKAMDTIIIRTRRYYRTKSKKSFREGNKTAGKYYAHKAEWRYLMDGILFKNDSSKAGKSYHVW